MTTVFDHIERLKTEYTDKYVIVDEERPELRRFVGMTGSVKTVNMSGRALVQFDAPSFEGWIDIDVDFLKVVDEPLPQPEKEAPAKKPAAKKPAAKPDTAKKAAPKAGGSVEDILAAARAGGSPKAESKPALAKGDAADKPAAKMSVEEMLAAARGNQPAAETKSEAPAKAAPAAEKKAPAAAAKDPTSMSVEEMLAAARAGTAAPAADASVETPAEEPAVEEPAAEEPAAEEPAAEEPAAEEPAAEEPAAESAPPAGDLPTEVDDILAWCRANG